MSPLSDSWPLENLRLRVGGALLRPVTEEDLVTLTAILPADLEMNPFTARPFGLDEPAARRTALCQEHWTARATWSPANWVLQLGVHTPDGLVGVQTLEGRDFAVLRTVETASWLIVEARGRGWGRLARAAALALAFDGLAAEVAVTEAWADNLPSLGVSTRLGYLPNGSHPHRRGERADELLSLRLDRANWMSAERPAVSIEGLADCRAWFISPSRA